MRWVAIQYPVITYYWYAAVHRIETLKAKQYLVSAVYILLKTAKTGYRE